MIASILIAAILAVVAPSHGRVVVSANHRFLQYEDGTPFFWLGDTAWFLLRKLDRPETERYLDNRQRKGFNVIQVMVLQDISDKTAAGVAALVDGKPEKPNLAAAANASPNYWDHLDWVIDAAAQRDIFVALVPAWGALAKKGQLTDTNVVAYTTFLARRYRGKPNLFWIVGGDTPGDRQTSVWKKMGQTLRKEDPGHLITYHPFGRTQSSMWFHNETWLDFNMFQSGHRRYDQDTDSPLRYGEDNWRYTRDDYARQPAKPVLDGEPSYERIPQGLHDPSQPYWTASDCRRYAYWSVFAGAFGHTYGDNAVIQFHTAKDGKGSFFPINFWPEAIDDPGSGQMQFLKRLMLSRPYFERVPDQSAISGDISGKPGSRYDYVAATRGSNYLFAYTYTGRPFEIRAGILTGAQFRAWWFNPRDGSGQTIGLFSNSGVLKFTPPGTPGPGNDWVLVLDDSASPARVLP